MNLFIHFLNRELYRSLGIKRLDGANNAFKVILLACGDALYVPLSSLWESQGCNDVDYRFIRMIYEAGQLELVSNRVTLDEFLERNRKMYSFDRARYADVYFSNLSKDLLSMNPTSLKSTGATAYISKRLDGWGHGIHLLGSLFSEDAAVLDANRPAILKANKEREEQAMTVSLFSGILPGKHEQYAMARLLSTYYIENYCNALHATIPTSVSNQIRFYDVLCAKETQYRYDIELLRLILRCAGIENVLFFNRKYASWEKILDMRKRGMLDNIYKKIGIIVDICASHSCGYYADTENKLVRKPGGIVERSALALNLKQARGIFNLFDVEILSENLSKIIDKMHVDRKALLTAVPVTFPPKETEEVKRKMDTRLFISHSSLDCEYIKLFTDLLDGLGMNEEQIICTSIPEYDPIPLGDDIYDFLKSQFQNFNLFVLFVLSDNYYNSAACLNEMGAAWVLQRDYISVLLPGFDPHDMRGAIDARKNGFHVDDWSRLFQQLNSFKNKIQSKFSLPSVSEDKWDRLKRQFYNDAKKLAGFSS